MSLLKVTVASLVVLATIGMLLAAFYSVGGLAGMIFIASVFALACLITWAIDVLVHYSVYGRAK